MSWLSGKPVRVLSLLWPEHDAIIQRTSDGDGYKRSGSYSVLDDQVLRAFYIHESNERSSTIYLAKIHDAIATNGTTVPFVRLATIPYVVHRIALLPGRAGFASLEFDKEYVFLLTCSARAHPNDTVHRLSRCVLTFGMALFPRKKLPTLQRPMANSSSTDTQ